MFENKQQTTYFQKNNNKRLAIPIISIIFASDMKRLTEIIKKSLSVRISLMVVFSMTILLMASMAVMLYYSRKAVKEEALQKATQTLESTVQQIDNIMLSIEQTTGNIFFSMLPHIDNPDTMYSFAKKLVDTNPYVAGCAIAFEEGYFKDQQNFFYVHRGDSAGKAYANKNIVHDDMFGNRPHTQQAWFTKPMESGIAAWINPLADMKDTDESPIITYSLPLYGNPAKLAKGEKWKPVGVIGVDMSLSLLSTIVADAKLSKNSYCTLLDSDGSYIVHPLEDKLMNKSALSVKEQSAKEAAQAMVSGDTGYRPFTLDGTDYYVFYKPFKRIDIPGIPTNNVKWSAGIVYPEDNIFGEYNNLTFYVWGIAIVGLMLLFLLCRTFVHRQLKPLLMLDKQAQRIAQGNYHEPVPDSKREDEVGRLQDNFSQMQKTLSSSIGKLEKLTTELEQHGIELAAAYKQTQKAERMKTAFLHNMTNQMLAPADAIGKDVEALCDKDAQMNHAQLAEDIQQKGNTIADLLKNLINMSDDELRKEADHA